LFILKKPFKFLFLIAVATVPFFHHPNRAAHEYEGQSFASQKVVDSRLWSIDKRKRMRRKKRDIMIVYDEQNDTIKIITIQPLKTVPIPLIIFLFP